MYEIGKWVAVKFNKQWYPGEVVDTSDNEIEIRCMGIIGENRFVWPETDDVCWYENSVLSSVLSHRILFVREDLDCVEKTLKK